MKELFREDDKIAYYASDDGKIFSLQKKSGKWREMKPIYMTGGYMRFQSCLNGIKKLILVHRAVWQAFNGPIPKGLEINHLNCVRDDNRLDNLELVTRLQNLRFPPTREHCREAMRHKMRPVRDLSTGVTYESVNEAARQTGLNHGSISACCLGKLRQTGGHIFKFLTEDTRPLPSASTPGPSTPPRA